MPRSLESSTGLMTNGPFDGVLAASTRRAMHLRTPSLICYSQIPRLTEKSLTNEGR